MPIFEHFGGAPSVHLRAFLGGAAGHLPWQQRPALGDRGLRSPRRRGNVSQAASSGGQSVCSRGNRR